MTEHVHEWRFGYRSDGNYNLPGASTPGFYCTHKDCGYDSGAWLSLAESESRLNATEKLNMKEARDYSEASVVMPKILQNLLSEYADILEGK